MQGHANPRLRFGMASAFFVVALVLSVFCLFVVFRSLNGLACLPHASLTLLLVRLSPCLRGLSCPRRANLQPLLV